jgi:hypothetical protein
LPQTAKAAEERKNGSENQGPKDFWAGVMFIGCGAFLHGVGAHALSDGNRRAHGAGVFPTVLGGLLAFLGALVLIESLAMDGPPVPKVRVPPADPDLARVRALRLHDEAARLLGATALLVFVSATAATSSSGRK